MPWTIDLAVFPQYRRRLLWHGSKDLLIYRASVALHSSETALMSIYLYSGYAPAIATGSLEVFD
jgi:hypothetical protein